LLSVEPWHYDRISVENSDFRFSLISLVIVLSQKRLVELVAPLYDNLEECIERELMTSLLILLSQP
jgi:hypothetical protein